MKLVIVESPNKCDTIARYLGSDFKVVASKGHIRDLAKRGEGGLGIDIQNGFKPIWEVSSGKASVIYNLQSLAKKASEVYLATDPDREGEAISYHLAEVLHLPIESTKRLEFHEITKPALEEALANPRMLNLDIVYAQEARRMEDRIIGFRISTLFKTNIGLESAGRVQSATLSMIVDRQKEIDAFVKEEYWTIEAEVLLNGKKYYAPLTKVDGKKFECHCKEDAEAIASRLPSSLKVTKIGKSHKTISPKQPFTTSTLQQEAFSKYHFSNSMTQSIAQKLYEGLTVNGEHIGLITYMRTDSTRISPNFYNKHSVPFVTERFGEEYIGKLPISKKGKNAQDAHEAIRPTGTHRTPEIVAQYVSPNEAKLYKLIYCRAIASLMAPKKVETTSVTLSGNGLEFSLSGSRTLFKGYEAIYGEFADKEEGDLPSLSEGEDISVSSVKKEQKFTKPDPQYNEASIVKAMEEKGIGRPSTYANTIKTLLTRKYVTKTKEGLIPTEDGFKSIETLRKWFPQIADTSYTATMETKLDEISLGKLNFVDAMTSFYGPFQETYLAAKEGLKQVSLTGKVCPRCGKPLVEKKNKRGQTFIGCSDFPRCKYIEKEEKEVEYTGENCPDCGKPLIFKVSKKGEKFIGCSDFPKCRYHEWLNEKKEND